ncbi:PDZ and LIM domain protein Zasp-like [Saccostrea echinata]|uniref:PDZ and LIM domain protein Zasp-like n=1 Tax=Saccostrea echinata TaxID=191078 RepID=UPI002A7FC7A9|nr:PDZ and LIM domain protein Zasp-like [Saccostrea echinata]
MSNIEYQPAETLTVQLYRPDPGISWGFRLQGGVDFSTPLSIQSVNPGSVAERSGLEAGDGILYINNTNADGLSHEQAKMEIIRAGNVINMTVQRGAVKIWKPKVTPMSDLRPAQMNTIKTATGDEVQTVQKTSLTRDHQPEPLNIGSSYNRSGKPFTPQSPKQAVPNVVHAQFNSPIGLYSANNIADTYAAQTAGIQQQMQGLDIAKTPVGAKMSGTYQPLEGEDNPEGVVPVVNSEADDVTPVTSDNHLSCDTQNLSSNQPESISQNDTNLHVANETKLTQPSGFRSVRAPDPVTPSPSKPHQENMHCGDCNMLVTGVFVRVKGVPYHPQCFKCTSCGVNLKQKGYFVVDGRLYCEVHAKQVAQPPGPNMKAVPVYMASVLTLEAKLERVDPTTPWGFRMQGGKEFGCPLTILKVNQGSLAAKCGLQQGDIILKIGNHETTNHKHKEAQDLIIGSGNKLDLLLQRGAPPPQHTYEKFATPTFNSYSSPSGAPPSGPQNYNTAAKPFGSPAPRPDVDSVTQQTSQLSFSPKPAPSGIPAAPPPPPPSQTPGFYSAAQKYADNEEKPAPSNYQSRSFKFLQGMMDSGQEPPSALRPAPGQVVRSVSPSTTQNNYNAKPRQFNTPQGLYSEESTKSASKLVRAEEDEKGGDLDSEGKIVYRPSETFKMVHEQDTPKSAKHEDDYKPTHSRTFKMLQEKLGAGDQPSTPKAPPPAPAAPSAPKPGVWTPPSAPAAKPFTPTVQPPAPAAPGGPKMGPPRNPTGVNAVRAKKGEAMVFKSGETPPGISRIPICASCSVSIRGPFVVALGNTWCPDHFVCQNPRCGQKLLDIGFVEEGGYLYCEKDYEQYFAPTCNKCGKPIVGECVNALQKTYHPSCFLCYQCKQPIGGNQFHLEDGNPYCENDWRQMFQTMCKGCDFPIEPGDHWVEAMGNNFHSECFNCSTCGVNLEGQPFYAKGGKPYCKKHTR